MNVQFSIGGKLLDLPSNIKLQFTKKNILFAFENIEVERTTSFNVPATPNNMLIFNFSHDIHSIGVAMRERLDAELRVGIVSKRGYLYVGSYSAGQFECIFVTGELLGLQAIKELGNIAQYIPANLSVDLGGQVYSADDDNIPDFGIVQYSYKYVSGQDIVYRPSYSIAALLTYILDGAGAQFDWSEQENDLMKRRIVIPSKYNLAPPTSVTLSRSYYQQPTKSQPYPTIGAMSASGSALFSVVKSSTPLMMIWDEEATDFRRGYVNELVCNQRLKITFPNNTPYDLYLGYAIGAGVTLIEGSNFGNIQWLGGRTVELASGQHFFFVVQADHVRGGGTPYNGWWIARGYDYSVDVLVEGVQADGEAVDSIRVKDNLPDINVVEFLKICAALSGSVLDFTASGLGFNRLLNWGGVRELRDVISWKNLTRTFADYAQNNYIQMDSAEDVIERVRLNYPIDNKNIEFENVLQTIPFTEFAGEIGIYDIVNNFIPSERDKYTLAQIYAGDWDMRNAEIPANSAIQSLTTKSTAVEVSAIMPLFEFEAMQQDVLLQWDNAQWVWTSATWGDGIATLQLSRIN